MSTEQDTNLDVTADDNLDSFAAEFFGENKAAPDNAKPEESESEPEVVNDAPPVEKQDTHSADDGAPEEDDVEETEDSEEPDPDADEKPKAKSRYQERINELTAKARQAERERDELLRKLNEKQTDPEPTKPKATETTAEPSPAGPSPTDKNEDGTHKYPLGEFDPKFVKDTVQHMLNEQAEAEKVKKVEDEKRSAEDQYRATLQDTWNEKLETAQERYPDYQEKGEQMLSVFEGIDPAYGQYLTDTLMEMDSGPEVFYYLANNIDEAEEIVNAGPRKATIALAKLEAQLAGTLTSKAPVKKTTNAPPPPPRMKGSAVSKASIPLDTDDLDAFSKVLFTKKK